MIENLKLRIEVSSRRSDFHLSAFSVTIDRAMALNIAVLM